MVIELSGVQFGLKSYAWFQNRTSAQREFDLKSQVWFETKIARHEVQLPLYYFHFEIAEFSQWCDIEQKWCDLKQKLYDLEHEWRDLEQMRFRAKKGAI